MIANRKERVTKHLDEMALVHDIIYDTRIALAEASLTRRLEAAEKSCGNLRRES